MLKRKVFEKLEYWKENGAKKALFIFGANGIGKTTSIREFAKENYENFVEINFITDENSEQIFAGSLDANTIIMNLTAYTRKPLVEKKTLIFLDEIQMCPNARTAIKFLVEDGRFDYIESGSLLGVKSKEIKSYPVGFEDIYQMFPMDFEEFLWANNFQEETIKYLKDCFDNLNEVSTSIHEIMKKMFYTYIVVGGMPEVVQNYIDTHDIAKVTDIQKSILAQYRLDIAQYAEKNDKIKIRDVFDSIPSQLNDKKRRFFVNSINKNARVVNYERSFKWLEDAGVGLTCYNVNEPKAPLKLNEKHNLFKLYLNDTGLLCSASMDNIQFDLLNGNVDINLGSILENLIAQQLKSNGFNLHYFDSTKIGEIDFVLQNGTKIDLIEVKSGKDYKNHKALNNVLSKKGWKFKDVYVLCSGNIKKEKNITYLPWYMVAFIKTNQLPKSLIYKVDISGLNIK